MGNAGRTADTGASYNVRSGVLAVVTEMTNEKDSIGFCNMAAALNGLGNNTLNT